MKRLIPFALGLLVALSTRPVHASDQICTRGVRIAFVQWRNQADVKVRFVQAGEDVRVRFVLNSANVPGRWRVVGRFDSPDLKVFVDQYPREDTVDVKIVDSGEGCK